MRTTQLRRRRRLVEHLCLRPARTLDTTHPNTIKLYYTHARCVVQYRKWRPIFPNMYLSIYNNMYIIIILSLPACILLFGARRRSPCACKLLWYYIHVYRWKVPIYLYACNLEKKFFLFFSCLNVFNSFFIIIIIHTNTDVGAP